jgi:hypothetical protein
VKTIAWINAIADSKATIPNNIDKGNIPKANVNILIEMKFKIKPAKITNNKCPAKILDPNLKPNDKALAI